MYAKFKDGKIEQFPYTIGQLRKDNPNVSFPKNIGENILQTYGVVGVVEGPQPACGPYQRVQRDALPHRPLIDEDTVAGYWMIGYTAVDMFSDYTDEEGNLYTKDEQEAAYQAGLDAEAAKSVRAERDHRLADTDWMALSDVVMSPEMTAYRQALRDITTQVGFPHTVEWPVKPGVN